MKELVGLAIFIVIVLILIHLSESLLIDKYFDMATITPEECNTGDIFLGYTDFSAYENRKLENFAFTGHAILNRVNFTHNGIIYRDPRYPRSDPGSLYVWFISCQHWENPNIRKYPWSHPGAHFVPFTAACALYAFCAVTPLMKPIPNEQFEQLVRRHEHSGNVLARTAPQYVWRSLKRIIDPDAPKRSDEMLFCTDILERHMTECGVFTSDMSVTMPKDLYINGNMPPYMQPLAPDQGLKTTQRVYFEPTCEWAVETKKFMEEFALTREVEQNLLFTKC